MKNVSVKIRITIWLTLLMGLLTMLLFIFMLSISSTVASQAAMTQLNYTVQNNLGQVSVRQGRLEFKDGFRFYQNGVSTLIYSKSEALLAGQIPVSFRSPGTFSNGLIRTLSAEEEEYLVLDLWMPMGWEDGIWVRGVMETPKNSQITYNLKLSL